MELVITMETMDDKKALSSVIDRFSILSAIILLAYAVTPLVGIPVIRRDWSFLGILLEFNIDFSTYIAILVPAFAAVGMYWLLEKHPAKNKDQYPYQHSILPAVTAWVIGLPLSAMLHSQQRWIVFALGGSLLLVVFVAEYIVVNPDSDQHAVAAGILKAISLALYLFLAIAVHAADLRLYLSLPALGIPVLLLLLRTFYLYSGGKWLLGWSIGITFVTGQLAVAAHYLPINSLAFGLLLTAPLYAMIDFAIAYRQGTSWHRAALGPVIVMVILLLLAFLL